MAAAALKVTAKDLKDFGLVDEVVLEEKAWEIGGPENEKKAPKTPFRRSPVS